MALRNSELHARNDDDDITYILIFQTLDDISLLLSVAANMAQCRPDKSNSQTVNIRSASMAIRQKFSVWY